MTERRSPADILNLTEADAASFLDTYRADPEDFVATYQQLQSTMPMQCRLCPALISLAVDVAAGEASLEEAVEFRRDDLRPDECGGAQLGVLDYVDNEGGLDGVLHYSCLSRAIK